jgi:hypothetical protein
MTVLATVFTKWIVTMSPTRKELHRATRAFSDKYTKGILRRLLKKIAGTPAMSEIPDDKLGAVIAACAKTPRELGISIDDDNNGISLAERTKRAGGHWRVYGREVK